MTEDPLPKWLTRAIDGQEFYTDERCFITELLNTDASPDVSVAIARVEPGVTTQLHALKGVTEVYILQQGSGIMQVGDEQHSVRVGDQVTIAAGTAQCIFNDGDIDLAFYCICTPRFMVDCYVNLEECN